MDTITFKVVLLGDGGVGKTTFVKKHKTGEFEKRYIPTIGVEISPLSFLTSYGTIQFNVWDIAGQDKFGGMREGYLIQAQAAIIMFDLKSPSSYNRVSEVYNLIKSVCGTDIPVVICGNKADGTCEVNPNEITFPKQRGLPYCDVSSKSNLGLEEPFLLLARSLTNRRDLMFVSGLSISAPESDPEKVASYLAEMEAFAKGDFPLPDESW